jgi:hypothetical protein
MSRSLVLINSMLVLPGKFFRRWYRRFSSRNTLIYRNFSYFSLQMELTCQRGPINRRRFHASVSTVFLRECLPGAAGMCLKLGG